MSHDPEAEVIEVLAVGMGTSTIRWALDALAAAGYTVTRDRYEPDEAVETFCTDRCRGGPKGCTDYCDSTRTVYRKIEASTDG